MKKVLNLDDWILDPKINNKNRRVEIKIDLVWPEVKDLLPGKPSERKKKREVLLDLTRQSFLNKKLFDQYEFEGKNKASIITKVPFNVLSKLEKTSEVWHIWITHISGARKKPKKITPKFFCVKMTVVIEIEGIKTGMQTIEERLVLIKAKSFDHAYDLVEKQRSLYEEPYLNSNGQLVRWRIDSFNDCYDTGFDSTEEMNDKEGVEVYSKLRTRRLKKEYIWDGKSDVPIKRL